MTQISIFEEPTGDELRDIGMKQALDHANQINDNWSKEAYRYLTVFLRYNSGEFMTENFRAYCEKYNLPTPPSLRAYGSIMVQAQRNGLIKSLGYSSVKNPKAHSTPATIWIKI